MITNNYYKMTAAMRPFFPASIHSSGESTDPRTGLIPVITSDGIQHYARTRTYPIFFSAASGTVNPANYNSHVMIGSGTTAATASDYRIENRITSGISMTYSHTSAYGTPNTIINDIYTILVTSSIDNLQISELGLSSYAYYASNYGEYATQTGNLYVLLYRETFPTITLNNGDICAFTLTFSNDYSFS